MRKECDHDFRLKPDGTVRCKWCGVDNGAHGYTEGADLPSSPFPQNPQVSAVQGPWSSIEESAKRIEQGIRITNRLNADFDHMVNQQKIIDDLRAKLEAAENLLLQETGKAMKYSQTIADLEKRVKELEQWKKEANILWMPILEYCHENAEILGIKLGGRISNRVLEILKTFNQPGG